MELVEPAKIPIEVKARDNRGEVRRFVSLVLALSVTEFKLRYYGSVLGYFWTLARPLMLFGVLYVVFTHIVKFGAGIQHYPVVLLTGIVMWTYFADATTTAVQSLVSRESLVRTMSFRLEAIPIATALTAGFNLSLNLVAVFVFILLSGVPVELSWLEFPLLILILFLIALPITMLLSALFVRFRDMQHIWEVVLQMGFWGTPIIYPIEAVPESLQKVIMYNPIAALLQQTRHALIDPSAPSAADAIGGAVWLLIPAGVAIGIFVMAVVVFRREAPNIAELI